MTRFTDVGNTSGSSMYMVGYGYKNIEDPTVKFEMIAWIEPGNTFSSLVVMDWLENNESHPDLPITVSGGEVYFNIADRRIYVYFPSGNMSSKINGFGWSIAAENSCCKGVDKN